MAYEVVLSASTLTLLSLWEFVYSQRETTRRRATWSRSTRRGRSGQRRHLRAWDGDECGSGPRRPTRSTASMAATSRPLVAAAAIARERVLDVGCCTGQTTREAARRAAPGSVLESTCRSNAGAPPPPWEAERSNVGSSSDAESTVRPGRLDRRAAWLKFFDRPRASRLTASPGPRSSRARRRSSACVSGADSRRPVGRAGHLERTPAAFLRARVDRRRGRRGSRDATRPTRRTGEVARAAADLAAWAQALRLAATIDGTTPRGRASPSAAWLCAGRP